MRRILELILKRNCFEFNGEFYAQVWGASQGNICSPEISDLVMYELEKKHILTDPNIIFYKRYRDDEICVYIGDDHQLQGLMDRLNSCHQSLKFTFEVSNQLVTYLDLQIFKGDRFKTSGRLDHKVNQKKTDTHQWLSPDSAHCPDIFPAMILGESIRYMRGCTSKQHFAEKINFFSDKLVERGYNRDNVNIITEKLQHENRAKYLQTSMKDKHDKKVNPPLVMVTTYTPHTRKHDLKSALLKHWNKIESNKALNKLFPNPPLLAYKRARNLADLIVRSKLPKIEKDKKPLHNQISIRGDNSRSTPDPSALIEQSFKSNECKLDQHDIELIDILNELTNE